MLSWLPRRRARMEREEAEAEALIRDLGVKAYAETRRRQREAKSEAMAREWNRVALAVARKMGTHPALDIPALMTLDADVTPDLEAAASSLRIPLSELNPVDEFRRFVLEALQRTEFRLQFRFDPIDRGPIILKEVDLLASDAPGAIREAAHIAWPPRAIGFRLVDREGREVFGRQKADRRWRYG